MPLQIAVAIIWHQGRVLVGRRSPHRHAPNKDEFPGGKVEPGESAEQAACRECNEETGIDVRVLRLRTKLIHDYPDRQLEIFFFDAEPIDQQLRGLAAGYRWVEPAELARLDFPEANRPVLDSLVAP